MNSQNREKLVLNPATGDLQLMLDPELGVSVKNIAKAPFTVLDGYTRIYPNLTIPENMTITVNEGGELIVV